MENMKVKEFIVWLLCLIGAVLSSFWIISTYTASNEILGNLNKTSNNLVFIIQCKTAVMTPDKEIQDKYSLKKEFISVYQVDKDFNADENEYEFVLNKTCFANCEMVAGKVSCNLEFTFLDTDGSELLTDTLYLTINFYDGSTVLEMFTLGGETANAYWLSYFNARGFDMRVYNLGVKNGLI